MMGSLGKVDCRLEGHDGAVVWMEWTSDPPNPPTVRYGNGRSGKRVNGGWWYILTAAESVMVGSEADGMLRETVQAVSLSVASPLCGMGK